MRWSHTDDAIKAMGTDAGRTPDSTPLPGVSCLHDVLKLVFLSFRLHMGWSYTQNALKTMGSNASCAPDSTLPAHTSSHPLHERCSKG